MTRRRVAAIDCGTNSLRLLIADWDGSGLTEVVRETRIVRLGQQVDRTRLLAPEALERARSALVHYAATIRDQRVDAVRVVATSAVRDARNQGDFVEMTRNAVGFAAEVIPGELEAALTFAGAASVSAAAPEAMLVADIGGGSTELVRRVDSGLSWQSMDVGSVRLTERRLHDDPPTPVQISAAEADVRAALRLQRSGPEVLVGVAGTVTTLAAVALGVARYDREAIHGATLTSTQVEQTAADLLAMSRAERERLTMIHPGRRDIIAAGALILRTLMRDLEFAEVLVSEHDILDGAALSLC